MIIISSSVFNRFRKIENDVGDAAGAYLAKEYSRRDHRQAASAAY